MLQYLSFENTGIIGKKLYKNVHLIDLIKIYDFGTNLKSNMAARANNSIGRTFKSSLVKTTLWFEI